jgi:hypothetical protein
LSVESVRSVEIVKNVRKVEAVGGGIQDSKFQIQNSKFQKDRGQKSEGRGQSLRDQMSEIRACSPQE